MTTATTATATVWEQEQLAECLRCGEAMTVAPVLHGIDLGGVYLCGVCFFHIYDGSKAQALEALGLGPADDGDDEDEDDDGPDGGPAAPAARRARGTLWLFIGGQAVARELSPDEEAELAEFVEACHASTPDPEPCIACSRPASPYEETPAGRVCWACWDLAPSPGTRPAGPDPVSHRAAALVAVC